MLRRSLRFLVCLALLVPPAAVRGQAAKPVEPAEPRAPRPLVLAGGTLVDVSKSGTRPSSIPRTSIFPPTRRPVRSMRRPAVPRTASFRPLP
jgi:hypothetical protein